MTLEEAKRRQVSLQKEAAEVIKAFKLKERLSKLGDFDVRGSYAYDLMVQRDIDINVYSPKPDIVKAADFAAEMLKLPGVSAIKVDNRYILGPESDQINGIFIWMELVYKGKVWKIDGLYAKHRDIDPRTNKWDKFHHSLTTEEKDAALYLKANLHEQGRYPGIYRPAMLYLAVKKFGVRTIPDLEKINPAELKN